MPENPKDYIAETQTVRFAGSSTLYACQLVIRSLTINLNVCKFKFSGLCRRHATTPAYPEEQGSPSKLVLQGHHKQE